MCILLEKLLSYSVRQTSVCNHTMCFEELRLNEAPKRWCQWTLKCVGAIVNVWSSIHRMVRVGQYKMIWTWYTVRTTLKSKLKRLLPCLLSVTWYVREVTAMPLVSDFLCERGYCMPLVSDFLCEGGYCRASCQWLSVREVTAMPLVSDFLCERGYCHSSCQWLPVCQRGYCHASCQRLAMWERLLPCLLPATWYVKHIGIVRQSDQYNHLGSCLVLRLVWILIWHVIFCLAAIWIFCVYPFGL
jgi:hypothetical protein